MILSYIIFDAVGIDRAEARLVQSEYGKKLLLRMLRDVGVNDPDIARDRNGRPYLVSFPNIDFNISHADNIAVCVLSVGEGRVGVDVEKANIGESSPRRDRLLERFFSKDKINSGKSLAELWTEKEAYLKYLGTGLSADLKAADPERDGRVRVERLTVGDYTVAVCLGKDAPLSVSDPRLRETGSLTEWE